MDASSSPPSLRDQVERWIATDPDPESVAELRALLASEDWPALEARFAGPLAFGTAGLRAPVGAGPARMNLAVVARTTAGLCRGLRDRVLDAAERGVCIGFDARLDSARFAEEAARVALGAGFRVWWFECYAPTPLVAFAVRHLGAAAGIVLTASHNPPQYNGYKVYWEDGAQLAPPHDAHIADAIAGMPAAAALPRRALDQGRADGRLSAVDAEVTHDYERAVAALAPAAHSARAASRLRIAYTPLHGVGAALTQRVLSAAGFTDLHIEPTQEDPDGRFPSVRFPNPEEAGAMDRVLALAERIEADVALAHDPDVDRLAVAFRDPSGRMVVLTGNEVAALLCEHRLAARAADAPPALVVSTIVSSPLIGAIAAHHHARWEQTLTGFKWIAHRAITLGAQGFELALGCEEALGYAFGDAVRDKDGIAAALLVADLAAGCKARGATLGGELERLFTRHGCHLSAQVSLALESAQAATRLHEVLEGLRGAPPRNLAGVALREVADLKAPPAQRPVWAQSLPSSDVLLLRLEAGQRAAIRPSGTEPKLKLYLDVSTPLEPGEAVASARVRAQAALDRLRDALLALLSPV